MCLSSVDHLVDPPKGEVLAWKVLHKRGDGLYRIHWGRGFPLRRRCWYRSPAGRYFGMPSYQLGFHVWKTREGARAWQRHCPGVACVVVRVKVRGVHTTGHQHGHAVLVASEEMIL